jgi:hypothetical protein
VTYAVVAHPALYHGIRHFLFILPPLCIIAGAGIGWALEASLRLWRGLFLAVAVTLGIFALKDVWTMVALHPHQYVYYNLIAGGVRGADQRYEMDYWQNFAPEAMAKLQSYVEAENGGRLPVRTYTIDVCVSPWLVENYMPSNFRPSKDWREADFFVATTNAGCADASPGRVIIEVERMGVVLGVVKDRRAVKVGAARHDIGAAAP